MAHRTRNTSGKRRVTLFKLGGTWGMQKKDDQLTGLGGQLDDQALAILEHKYSNLPLRQAEQALRKDVIRMVSSSLKTPRDIASSLPWVPHIDTYVEGDFYSLFAGDSSHIRFSLISPLVCAMLSYANSNPDRQILGAQGTDTADMTILPFLDAFLFDTELLPVLLSGSNRTHDEWNSDAPKNFVDMFQLTGASLPAGSYWVFGSHLYKASDLVKIDPIETRRIETYTTFFAPRGTSRFTKKVISENWTFEAPVGSQVDSNHPVSTLDEAKFFDALCGIRVVDVGNLNSVEDDVYQILDASKKAVIIAAYAFGNTNNPVRKAAVQAAKTGKLVVVIDKSLLGVVNSRYKAGLVLANSAELANSGQMVISGQKMNKATARAVLTRALYQGYDQKQTQELINLYCEARELLS